MKRSVSWDQVPKPVKLFLLKAICVFVAWKAVYLLILLPNRVLDKPLTYVIGKSTAATLNVFRPSLDYSAVATKTLAPDGLWYNVMAIRRGKDGVLSIGDVCNGLEVFVLYAGLIVCLPGSLIRKFKFILVGILLIEILNVLRCAGLALIYINRPEYLDFSHHYLFTFVIYAFIFWLWYLFSRDQRFAKKLQPDATTL